MHSITEILTWYERLRRFERPQKNVSFDFNLVNPIEVESTVVRWKTFLFLGTLFGNVNCLHIEFLISLPNTVSGIFTGSLRMEAGSESGQATFSYDRRRRFSVTVMQQFYCLWWVHSMTGFVRIDIIPYYVWHHAAWGVLLVVDPVTFNYHIFAIHRPDAISYRLDERFNHCEPGWSRWISLVHILNT